MSRFVESLEELMRQRGLNGQQLAEKSDISAGYISKIRSGQVSSENISLGYLAKIANALDVTVGELIGDPGFILLRQIRSQMSDNGRRIADLIAKLPNNSLTWHLIMDVLRLSNERSPGNKEGSESDEDDSGSVKEGP